jgi:PTH1 family peptidyl-tRNA hydrolase
MAKDSKTILVAGLGNPGAEYEYTRHNAGFKTVDLLGERMRITYWKSQCGARVGVGRLDDKDVVLAQPQSFMNTSGGPVGKLCREYGIEPDRLIVVHDELDIPAGDVRVKIGGGAGGHNGLKSIIANLGSNAFTRVRVGIGRPPGRMDPADYVLKQLRGTDLEEFEDTVNAAANAVEDILALGAVRARDKVNAK